MQAIETTTEIRVIMMDLLGVRVLPQCHWKEEGSEAATDRSVQRVQAVLVDW